MTGTVGFQRSTQCGTRVAAGRPPAFFVPLLMLVLLVWAVGGNAAYAAADSQKTVNRYNVVVVLDTSGSMLTTDAEGNRFEAIAQFAAMLSEQGNTLGGVVFSDHVGNAVGPIAVSAQKDKDRVTSLLRDAPVEGDTNIGDALATAVDMLRSDGDTSLPSVIVLLSDGNTDLPTRDAVEASLASKAEALQRAREAHIKIYSICLNADGSADTSEMRQISSGTNGAFQEVKNPEDLRGVFNAFYELIYGGSTIELVNEAFPAGGVLETPFTIPAMGVEEVNVVIYGNATSYVLMRPDGKEETPSIIQGKTFTLIKLTDVMPGKWVLKTQGVPGDRVRINMVYNTNLEVKVEAEPADRPVNPADDVTFTATLAADGEKATKASQLEGYAATLVLLSDAGGEAATYEMKANGGTFTYAGTLDEGNWHYRVDVAGNGITRSSEVGGPVVISADADPKEFTDNRAPEPVENPVEHTVVIWPFRDNSLAIDLATLATDDQAEPLTYAIASTSFMDADYTREGDVLTVTGYSVPTGAFTVRATDKWGASCDVEVIVHSHNVGLYTLIAVGVGAVVALVVVILGIRKAMGQTYNGQVSVQAYVAGRYSGKTIHPTKGKQYLDAFDLDPTGINYLKAYFTPTGTSVVLHTDEPVKHAGAETKEVRVGITEVTVEASEGNILYLRFIPDN